MRAAAGKVWSEQGAAHSQGLQLNEETLTEMSALRLARSIDRSKFRVDLFNKGKEKKTGADWEWAFRVGGRFLRLRVQAKRLFANGRYQSFKRRGAQTNTLLAQARKSGAYPCFVFFNYEAGLAVKRIRKQDGRLCDCPDFRGFTYFGATLASAELIAAPHRAGTAEIHKVAIPWHCLFCRLRSYGPAMTDGPTYVAALKSSSAVMLEQFTDLGSLTWERKPPEWISESDGVINRELAEDYLLEYALTGLLFIDENKG